MFLLCMMYFWKSLLIPSDLQQHYFQEPHQIPEKISLIDPEIELNNQRG
jgi:hypothetical protein